MSFRPLRDDERLVVINEIEKVEKQIGIYHQYIIDLKKELTQGVWECDIDWSSFPEPVPDCYICMNRTPVLNVCKIPNYNYGIACKDYRHFTNEEE